MVLEISEAKLIHSLNYKSEMLFNVIDTYDNQLYPIKKKDPEKFNEIMTQVYKKTHKTKLSGKKLDNWIENFPNMIDRKIQAEKTKLKKKLKSPKRAKKGKEIYITSPLRNRNILNKMEKMGYYSINTKGKTERMKAGLKDDEIVADLVEEISDPYGGDHDMVEIMYDDQFKRHIEEYEDRYKYVYAVEDIKTKKKEKRDVLIRKDIVSVIEKPKRKVKIIPVKKPIKKQIKLFSSIILSDNPIKITPTEKLEYVKKKPIKKAPIKKKKPPVKKKPTVKKKSTKKLPVKKKPTIKRKPTPKKKPIVRKKPVKKKKPTKKSPGKKKPTPKKKRVAKKKPKPKVKTMRAKRRNSPVTGRWTARYRIINGKRRKVKIRKFKGKIQTRIIN